ncbi:nucleotidyl transferase AbiEii/AbiGii toxin family protein [Streptomyces sp. FH025]|uniref:nucleotidyl transferase AbiEii/AbiGii toxin family protein n=1 Tax=Streptomyces sp. FH025 TaxID=2815937 RepID=UPI001A9F6303|nr:nucleotidyl transferase AbiEii/AbiGii toxin family protein [Streptomyces sp. FH025]MBO1414723.1 nucleotidyl transferase AbiEii/AbiGii toxin family protein [Streptomyces sp. FH025]
MTENQLQPQTQTHAPVAVAWEELQFGPWQGVLLPKQPPAEDVREDRELPRSIRPIDDEAVTQQPVFDPALAGYGRALRPSEPAFTDPLLAERWLAARREALNTALSAVAASPWAEHLVLRGSILLRAWYGEQAREPGDLDFVVRPTDWELEDERTDRMFEELAAGAERLSGTVRLHADQAVSDEIWTYSRIPGRRLVLPWSAPGVPGGTVQLDFVFTEHLSVPPQPYQLPGVTGPLLAATPQLSLAWKILWLVSDNHPQGKDLYDAILLSRTAEVPYELLRQVFIASDEDWLRWPVVPQQIAELHVDWDEFAKDYPQFAEPVEEYPAQLLARLHATFADRGEYALHALWLAPLIEELRQTLTAEGMDEVQQRMSGRHLLPVNALVVTRELLGGDLRAADRIVADHLADRLGSQSNRKIRQLTEAADRFAEELAEEPADEGRTGGAEG